MSLAVDGAQLYEQYKDMVFRLCLRLGAGNAAWAEDLTHDVFIKTIEHAPRLPADTDIAGWLYRVTVNTCLSRLRRDGTVWERVRQRLVARGRPHPSPPDEVVSARREVQELFAALQRLPPKERVVFAMHYLDGLSQKEICEQLGLSKGYVSKLLRRALEKLEVEHAAR